MIMPYSMDAAQFAQLFAREMPPADKAEALAWAL